MRLKLLVVVMLCPLFVVANNYVSKEDSKKKECFVKKAVYGIQLQSQSILIDAQNSIADSVEDMLLMAAELYSQKKYDEAFALYQKIAEEHPDNGEAWYHLGIMYFKNEGVSLSRKQRTEKAIECLKKSDTEKARRMILYISDGR